MMGLLSPPAVMRLLSSESTPVRLAVAVGHRLERTSRVTCSDASAVSRATDTCGLFFNARASPGFKENGLCAPGLAAELEAACPFGTTSVIEAGRGPGVEEQSASI